MIAHAVKSQSKAERRNTKVLRTTLLGWTIVAAVRVDLWTKDERRPETRRKGLTSGFQRALNLSRHGIRNNLLQGLASLIPHVLGAKKSRSPTSRAVVILNNATKKRRVLQQVLEEPRRPRHSLATSHFCNFVRWTLAGSSSNVKRPIIFDSNIPLPLRKNSNLHRTSFQET